jgi:hypothetical protein
LTPWRDVSMKGTLILPIMSPLHTWRHFLQLGRGLAPQHQLFRTNWH